MNAARIIASMGASVSLVDGKLKLAGLDRLDRDTAVRVLELARVHKAEIVAELRGDSDETPTRVRVCPDATPLEALSRFERDPRGVVEWLSRQEAGQPPHLVQRWAACVREEARLGDAAKLMLRNTQNAAWDLVNKPLALFSNNVFMVGKATLACDNSLPFVAKLASFTAPACSIGSFGADSQTNHFFSFSRAWNIIKLFGLLRDHTGNSREHRSPWGASYSHNCPILLGNNLK